jgi:UDP-glucose 4-epimerase
MSNIILKNNTILVTGGAGFVGSNIVRILVNQGAKVTVLDNLFAGFENLLPKSSKITFIKGDICDKKLVNELVKKHKYIIHAAAKSIIISCKNPIEDYETNIGGTLNLLTACKEYGVEKFVYTGSASVYGNPSIIPIPENSAIYTLSPYAVSKLAGENYCTSFYESYNTPTAIVRYSNVYGVNQDPRNPYCGVISKFFKDAIKGNTIKIHGDGEQTRDFTYVDDAANATIEALVNPKAVGNIFNTGSGHEVSINNLAKKIIRITNSESIIENIDKRDIDNIRRRAVNIEHIRRVLRWSPIYNLEKGLENTYDWLKKSI